MILLRKIDEFLIQKQPVRRNLKAVLQVLDLTEYLAGIGHQILDLVPCEKRLTAIERYLCSRVLFYLRKAVNEHVDRLHRGLSRHIYIFMLLKTIPAIKITLVGHHQCKISFSIDREISAHFLSP